MRRINRPHHLWFALGLALLAPSLTWGQGAPPAGTTVVARMIDAVDSQADPAGKPYRATVTKPVAAGGVSIAQGAAATVILVRQGSGWIAQLTSVTINGQPVAVTSSAVVVSNPPQGAAGAASAIASALGHHSSAAAAAAVAIGARVVLPAATTLMFVLGAPPPATAAVPAGAAAPHPTSPASPTAGAAPNAAGAGTASGSAQLPAGGSLNANVTETLLGPSRPAGAYVVSPDGGHLATASTHGSRPIIIVDGVDGPEFDKAATLLWGTGAIDVAFSPDGKRSAYLAQKGDQLVAVVDGKEAFVVMNVKPEAKVPGIDQRSIHRFGEGPLLSHQFIFSQSGAHVAVVAQEPGAWYLFLDGVKSPPYAQIDLRQVAFVEDKLVYAAMTADQKWHMVVNDQPGPAYAAVSSLQLSDNNQHYAFIGQNVLNSVVVADGVAIASNRGASNLVVASNGRVAYLGAGPDSTKAALFVGNQPVSTETPQTHFFAIDPATGEQRPANTGVFSPDGSKFGYPRPIPGGIAAVIDGKQSLAYDGIGLMQFSPDSRHAFFVGQKGALNFVVIDGQEMPGQGMPQNFVFSQEGGRFGYEAGASMVVDGKETKYRELIAKTLTFSADGKHYAYSASAQVGQSQLVEDGKVTNIPGLGNFIARTGQPRIVSPSLIFSPDGTRLAYVTNANVVVINGQEVARAALLEFPGFSPDSKHFAVIGWTGKSMSVFADGKVGPTYDDIIEANRNVVRFEDARTLRFLGVKGGSVYRVVVTFN